MEGESVFLTLILGGKSSARGPSSCPGKLAAFLPRRAWLGWGHPFESGTNTEKRRKNTGTQKSGISALEGRKWGVGVLAAPPKQDHAQGVCCDVGGMGPSAERAPQAVPGEGGGCVSAPLHRGPGKGVTSGRRGGPLCPEPVSATANAVSLSLRRATRRRGCLWDEASRTS